MKIKLKVKVIINIAPIAMKRLLKLLNVMFAAFKLEQIALRNANNASR